jgi:chromosome segregation protein
MRLKSLHIKGFKSFANETILNFNEDVIGVVGPNGSGKSNIVDAIRWVLGEQKSKELRLEAMSDIIFNGTKTKKESATAMVSLIFDNDKGVLPSEYNTVAISRTLYRNGDSEYKLNNVPCRLKDINTLFLDTGIGSNSYAIIALGMVDDILADKDNARRRMFEQAAGVSKYKIRKRETLSKLKSTTEDLNRVDDLLFEIDANLKSLEKQAKRTQKFLDLKAEYKELSVKYAVLSIHELKNKYKGINEQLLRDQDTYRGNDAVLYKKEALLQKEKKSNTDVETSLSNQQKKVNDLVYQIRTRENDKGLLSQSLGFKKQTKDQALLNLKAYEEEKASLVNQVNSLSQRIVEEVANEVGFTKALETSKINFEKIKEQYNAAKSSFDTTQRIKQEYEREMYDIEKEIAIWANSRENANREIAYVKENLVAKATDYNTAKADIKQFDANYAAKESELNLLLETEENRKANLLALESQRDQLQEQVIVINRNIDSKQNEHDLLKSMVDSMEGFPESIKFLHDQWRKDIPLLSDVIDVQEVYKASIELLLEPFLNHYVVNTTADAVQAITLLKKSQKGKVNFFILDQIKTKAKSPRAISGLIPAIDVIQCDAAYLPLAAAILHDWYIFEGDIEVMDRAELDVNILSSYGTFIKAGYTMTGGSVGLFEGKKIGRKQNLEKLAKYLDDHQAQKAVMTTKLEALKMDIQKVKADNHIQAIEATKKAIQMIEQERIRYRMKIQSFETLTQESEAKIQEINHQLKALDTKTIEGEKQANSLKSKISDIDKVSQLGNEDVDLQGRQMSQASETYNGDNIALIRQQNLISNFKKDLEFKESRRVEVDDKIASDMLRIKVVDKERIDIEDQIVTIERELKELYIEKKAFQQSLSEVEQGYFQAKNQILELEDEISKLSKAQNQLQNTIQNLKDQFTEQKFQIQSVGERLRIEFNININDVINQPIDETWNYEDITAEVEKLKNRMHGYGDINPLAVEAYNEMKIRCESITVQRNDILEAQTSLMDTIQEIEKTATDQFMEAFEKVRLSFIDVFRSLFTDDDTCDLILLDQDNPLDSDIEIIAKPKGKKPKSLSQLSGGEKTLTATALLFALYLLKPAPFCIFDEVDAPLDDANIQKFNRIIKKFSTDSQFIIVTHNKSTMAEVDVLYGVYMSEPGVSAVSAVDFRALKHDPILESLS